MTSIALALPGMIAAFCFSFAVTSHAYTTTYRLTELGTLGGDFSMALGINNLGQVVGSSNKTTSGFIQATLWNPGSVIQLGDLGGVDSDGFGRSGGWSFANAINDKGRIVGSSYGSGNIERATLWSNGTIVDLGAYSNYPSSAWGIDQFDRIVGFAYLPVQPYLSKALAWNGSSGAAVLPTLGGEWGGALGINDAGTRVGYSITEGGAGLATAWVSDLPYGLGTLGGDSFATAVNTQGTIVGYSFTSPDNNYYHAARWSDFQSAIMDLGTLGGAYSFAYSVNSHGSIVGVADTGDEIQHAFIWVDGTMYDLNDQLDASGSGWRLALATSINGRGQIVGGGTNPQGQFRGFLLTPVPEPEVGQLMLFAIALIGVLAGQRQRCRLRQFDA